jgi:DnaK suppressor protein
MTAFDAPPRPTTHLSDEALMLLRSLLLCELAEQSEQAADCRATIEDLTGQADVDSALERELAEASAGHADRAVLDVRRALDRLDSGTYGRCEACGEPIPVERLEAIPYTQRCVACPSFSAPAGLLG